jgi:phospholipid/cholesterol/gamma-HCH transport system substrate-binding protein
MITRKYETIVGIFVVASLGALLVIVLIIAQQERLWQEHVKYQVVFKNVSGLKKGSEVHLAGVTVGSVDDITIDPHGNTIVTFEVVDEYRDRIRADSKASIGYQGLLGDKSLDLTPGSRSKPEIAAGGTVKSVEPWDITEMLTKAAPDIENLKKAIANLATITTNMTDPDGHFNRSLKFLGEITDKVNKGQGTLGMLVNDPELYQKADQALGGAGTFVQGLNTGKGVLPALVHDQALRDDLKKMVKETEEILANLRQTTDSVKKAAALLPDLVTSGQGVVSDAGRATKAAQKSWFLRRNIPKPKERTIQMEQETRKE